LMTVYTWCRATWRRSPLKTLTPTYTKILSYRLYLTGSWSHSSLTLI